MFNNIKLKSILIKLGIYTAAERMIDDLYKVKSAFDNFPGLSSARKTQRPMISIVILAWPPHFNEPFNFKTLIASIVETTKLPFEIILVFNSFPKEMISSLEAIPVSETDIKVAFLYQNVGTPRGWNIGSHMAEGDVLVFINEDALVGDGCLDKLASSMLADKDIGVAGPSAIMWDFENMKPLSDLYEPYIAPEKETVDCDIVSGFFFAISKEVFIEAGEIDDRFSPCFFEEVDLCLRAMSLGYRNVVVRGLECQHESGVSSYFPWKKIEYLNKKDDVRRIAERNRDYFLSKWK